MELHLAQKHVLITGASKGIGFACAQLFLQEGAHVTLIARNQQNLEQAQEKLSQGLMNDRQRIHIESADLRNASEAQQALERAEQAIGAVDVLVNSAGAAVRTPAPELTPTHWRDAMDAKFFTYINMIDPTIKRMAQRQEGVIVNVIGAGGKTATPTHIAGGSANAALMLATAGLATAYGRQGIRVLGVNPGATLTERLEQGLQAICASEEINMETALAQATARVALGRLATPEEVAQAVVFLASSQASYLTGVNINMDGGAVASIV